MEELYEKITERIFVTLLTKRPHSTLKYLLHFVKVIPRSYSIVNEFVENVQIKISRDGGNIQYRWQVWEWVGIYIEAAFHTIWVSTISSM